MPPNIWTHSQSTMNSYDHVWISKYAFKIFYLSLYFIHFFAVYFFFPKSFEEGAFAERIYISNNSSLSSFSWVLLSFLWLSSPILLDDLPHFSLWALPFAPFRTSLVISKILHRMIEKKVIWRIWGCFLYIFGIDKYPLLMKTSKALH